MESTYPPRPLARAVPRERSKAGPHPVRLRPDLLRAPPHGFYHEVGFRLDRSESRPGRYTVLGTVERRHLNINGAVHGGVYATILDTAMGASVLSKLAPGETAATITLTVEYLRGAGPGTRLTARGRLLRRGRHIAFAEGDLSDEEGTPLGRAHGTWYIWSDDAAPPPKGRRPGRHA